MNAATALIDGFGELADDLAAGRPVHATVICKGFIMEQPGAPNTLATMPPTPRNGAMTPAELKRLIKAAGLADATKSKVARVLGVARSHLYRMLTKKGEKGHTPIDEANAMLFRAKLAAYAKTPE